jgi:glyoxylase-like metal-dependent hydrolase (beta-lactamase superfamily II)
MEIVDKIHGFLWQSFTENNCNTYLMGGSKWILIDPGHLHLFDHVETGLTSMGLGLNDIDVAICTHGHPDHIEGMGLFKDRPARTALHETEWQFCRDMAPQLQSSLGMTVDGLAPDILLTEGDLTIGDIHLKVYHTPGHSPGSVCLYWPEEKVLITGDLIFKDGLGRTDLPGGNGTRIKESIRRMATLDVEWILPGHGDVIAGADQVKANFERLERQWFAYV